MTWRRALAATLAAAAFGFAIFGMMVARVTHVERLGARDAEARFVAILDSLPLAPPILVTEHGELVRRPPPDPPSDVRPHALHVLAYRHQEHGLVRSTIPFWFLRLKMPAVRFALRESGVDLDRFALKPDELSPYGPSIVFEERRPSGDRLLIWTD